MVARVTPNSPAEKAGLRKGDLITNIGGATPKTLPDFYRKLWSMGNAGILVPLDIERDGRNQHFRCAVHKPYGASEAQKLAVIG